MKPETPFGFRMATFTLQGTSNYGEKRGDKAPPLAMNNPAIHGSGAPGLILEALHALSNEPPHRDRNQHHNEILEIAAPNLGDSRFVLCTVKGGRTGEEYDVTDPDGDSVAQVDADNALTWPGRVLFVFPNDDSPTAFVAHETRNGAGHGTQTLNRLKGYLTREQKIWMDWTNDLADSRAWGRVLADDQASVEQVEFITPPEDGVGFAEELNVRRVRLILELSPEKSIGRKLLNVVVPHRVV